MTALMQGISSKSLLYDVVVPRKETEHMVDAVSYTVLLLPVDPKRKSNNRTANALHGLNIRIL